ncbi:MAG: hypothetical protein ACOYB3_07305 [Azonexus sp.]
MRKTSREISRLVGLEKVATPGFVPTLKLLAVGADKMLKMVGSVVIGADTFELASDSGKIKTFSTVDDFLRYVAKAAEKGDGVYNVEVNTGALLASSVPSNISTWAASKIVSLGKTKANQIAAGVALDGQIASMAGWNLGNAAQQAKLAETQAQKAAVLVDIAAIDTEVVRLQALV